MPSSQSTAAQSWRFVVCTSRNVVATHLLDRRLHDFAAVRATGEPDSDGDLAFDVDIALEHAAPILRDAQMIEPFVLK